MSTIQTVFDFSVTDARGQILPLSAHTGEVLLLVNTASACRFTPQYTALQTLHQTYAAQGLRVLAFPCNQFLHQESGSNDEIHAFCELMSVTFPVLDKIDVNGVHADPLWQWLKHAAPGVLGTEAIKWNFTKFLIGRDGRRVTRYAPSISPHTMRADIERLLGERG